jgi:chromosome segregation ATPase
VVTLKSQVNAYRSEAEKQHIAAEGTLESLQAVADERDALNASLQAISCERDALKDQLGGLQEKIDNILTTQLAEALKQITSMQNDHDEEVRNLRMELDQRISDCSRDLEHAQEQNARHLRDALSRLEVSETSLAQKQTELDEAIQTLVRVENEMKQTQQERFDESSAADNALRALQTEHAESMSKLQEAHRQETDDLKMKIDASIQDFQEQILVKDRELQEAEKILTDSRGALADMEKSFAELQLESERTKSLLVSDSSRRENEMVEEITRYQAVVADHSQQLLTSQQELSSKTGMVQVLEQALDSLKAKIEEKNSDLKKKSEDIVKLQDDVHKREQENDLLVVTKEQIKDQLDRQSHRIDTLQEQLAQEAHSNATKSSAIQNLQVRIMTLSP